MKRLEQANECDSDGLFVAANRNVSAFEPEQQTMERKTSRRKRGHRTALASQGVILSTSTSASPLDQQCLQTGPPCQVDSPAGRYAVY